jgi:hypothetical protein
MIETADQLRGLFWIAEKGSSQPAVSLSDHYFKKIIAKIRHDELL